MLDTIVLKLPKDDFMVREPDRFTPSARNLFCPPYSALRCGGLQRYTQNPTIAEKCDGIYKPRLTIIKGAVSGGYTLDLRVEFSAPKLIFGNNFDELDEGDFEAVIETLNQRLCEMGIEIKKDALRSAAVSAAHFSKNIVLKGHATSSAAIGEIAKINFNSRLDLNKVTFRNDGHAVSFHANSYELTFYDKIKDLEQSRISPKRSIEGDDAHLIVGRLPNSLEVLRMEVRLGKRAKIAHIFRKLGISLPIRFDGIFKKNTSQKILLHFWDQAASDLDLMQMAQMRPEDVFLAIQKYGRVKTGRALQLTGAFTLNQSVGMRGLRALVENGKAGSLSRLRKGLESLPKVGTEKLNTIKQIKNSLVDFYPLKLQDFDVMS